MSISAVDAVSPAVHRTKTFLFRPFRLGTYLKLCLVAVVTEGLGSNFNSSTGRHRSAHGMSGTVPFSWNPLHIAMAVAMLLLVLLFCWWLFYLVTRLRFAFFHCLIHNIREIRPGWGIYREQATHFFWFNTVVALAFLLLCAVCVLPFLAGFLALFRTVQAGGHPGFGAFLVLILPLIPIFLLLMLTALTLDIVLRDLMLPHFALENATAGEAWRAVWARIRGEFGTFLGYAVLRVILPIAAMIGLFMVLAIPAIIFVVMVAGAEVVIHAMAAHAGGAAAAVGIFLEVVIGVAAFSLAFLVGVVVGGPVSTAMREYALVFYGGRYQRLGEILYPPPPPATPVDAPSVA